RRPRVPRSGRSGPSGRSWSPVPRPRGRGVQSSPDRLSLRITSYRGTGRTAASGAVVRVNRQGIGSRGTWAAVPEVKITEGPSARTRPAAGAPRTLGPMGEFHHKSPTCTFNRIDTFCEPGSTHGDCPRKPGELT